MRVATVTVNPAIDETVKLDQLVVGTVHRANSVRFDIGGKGVNVAVCLAHFGIRTAVTGYLGADNAQIFEQVFQQRAIEDRFIRRSGQTRTNIKIVDKDDTTDVNLVSDPVTEKQLAALEQQLQVFNTPDWLLVMSGSLLPNMSASFYAQEVAKMAAKHKDTKIIIDCSGDALQEVLKADILPYSIKPNIDELSQYCGKKLSEMAEILQIARGLVERGMQFVTVSMGGQGALFVDKDKAIHARLKVTEIESTVGAGDAMVAGISAAICENADLERIARLGTAFAVGKLGCHGPALPAKEKVEELAAKVECQLIA